jgi:hypothetical protein
VKERIEPNWLTAGGADVRLFILATLVSLASAQVKEQIVSTPYGALRFVGIRIDRDSDSCRFSASLHNQSPVAWDDLIFSATISGKIQDGSPSSFNVTVRSEHLPPSPDFDLVWGACSTDVPSISVAQIRIRQIGGTPNVDDVKAFRIAAAAEAAWADRQKRISEERTAERAKLRANCRAVFTATADKKVKDLTVREEQAVRACQALGMYPPN